LRLVLASQYEQIKGVKHNEWGSAAEALKEVEGRPALFVERHHLAVNDSVARKIRDRFRDTARRARIRRAKRKG
jgi:hypothetical protein